MVYYHNIHQSIYSKYYVCYYIYITKSCIPKDYFWRVTNNNICLYYIE